MTTRTWAGGTGEASDPTAWTPAGAPQPGDTLNMQGGAMLLSGDELAGDPIHINKNGVTDAFNLSGDSANLVWTSEYGATVTVNVPQGTTWVGGFDSGPQSHVGIGGGGTFENDVNSTIDGNSVVIDAPITGAGTLKFTTPHSATSPGFELKQAVGAGQTVQLVGGATGYEGDPHLTIDDLTDYHATTQLGWGELTLAGLHADSYALDTTANTLTLYQGGNQVGQLANFYLTGGTGQAPSGFGVTQTGEGIVLHGDGAFFKGGPNLPVHTPSPPHPPFLARLGGNGDAGDPSQWTPTGTPSPGAVAFMANGTINLGGGDPMSGAPLYMPLQHTSQTLNVNGDDHLQWGATSFDDTTVNLADGSHWIGGLGNNPGATATVNATGSGKWDNGFSFIEGDATVNAPVGGFGGMIVLSSQVGNSVEFQQGVGNGQVVGISGTAQRGAHATVTVDDLADYHATTVMGFGELVLKGLSADAWSLQNDTLTLFQGGNAVDQMRFGIGAVNGFGPQGLAITQTAAGVNVHTDGDWYHGGGTVLPRTG